MNNQLIISLAHLTKSYDLYMLKTEYLDIWTRPVFFLLALASGRVPVMHTGLKKMQNGWTINIKQNLMSHTRITHDKFRTNKIQNGRQSAILFIFSHYLVNFA